MLLIAQIFHGTRNHEFQGIYEKCSLICGVLNNSSEPFKPHYI